MMKRRRSWDGYTNHPQYVEIYEYLNLIHYCVISINYNILLRNCSGLLYERKSLDDGDDNNSYNSYNLYNEYNLDELNEGIIDNVYGYKNDECYNQMNNVEKDKSPYIFNNYVMYKIKMVLMELPH